MAKSKLWVVGDSWSYGWSGTDRNGTPTAFTHNMCTVLSRKLLMTVHNHSRPGASIGQITNLFLTHVLHNIAPGDVVFICAPPDSRFHTVDHTGWVNTALACQDNGAEYLLSLIKHNDNSTTVFKWHFAMFCQLMYDAAVSKGAQCYVQHNYGALPTEFPWLREDIFLDTETSMWQWLGLPANLTFLHDDDGPSAKDLDREFAKKQLLTDRNGNLDLHPSQANQLYIGERLADLIHQRRNTL